MKIGYSLKEHIQQISQLYLGYLNNRLTNCIELHNTDLLSIYNTFYNCILNEKNINYNERNDYKKLLGLLQDEGIIFNIRKS